MCWQPMDIAPKTGEVVVGDFAGWPVMMAWMKDVPRKESRPEMQMSWAFLTRNGERSYEQ